MNPAMIERLKAVENQAEAMGRGARSAYLKQQAQELGISLPRYTASWRRSASSRRANGAAMRARRSLNRKKPN